ncbi:hypothetical protein RL07_013925 [Staphylococcus aureus]|nr:hypothetical protein DD555_00720 [Staphylococcus aureus]PNN49457.1 hypothetical protein RL07_013925 [Staphylococcus aureus]
MFLSLKTLYRKRTVIWPFYFYTIIRTLSSLVIIINSTKSRFVFAIGFHFLLKIFSLNLSNQ